MTRITDMAGDLQAESSKLKALVGCSSHYYMGRGHIVAVTL